jgi:hypothetical protein
MRTIRTADIILFALALAVALGFGWYLSASRVTDPFLYYDVAFVKHVQMAQSTMDIPTTGPFASLAYVPGREMLMIQLAGMMGVAPETLQFLPVGAVLVTIALYVLARRLLGSPYAAFLLTVYLSTNLSHSSALYSVFAYALALPIVLTFMLVGMRLFERKDPRDVLLLALLFVGTHSIHYTMATWLITFLLGANALIWLQGRLAAKVRFSLPSIHGMPLKAAPYLLVAIVVFFIAFNEAVYKSFLPLISGHTLDSAVQRFLSYLSFGGVEQSPYRYTRAGVPTLASTLALGIILIPVIIGLAYDARRLFKRAVSHLTDKALAPLWGIAVLGIIDAASYAVRGSVSTKSFSLLFPLLALAYAKRTGRPAVLHALAFLLAVSSLVKVGLFYANSYVISPDPVASSYSATQASSEWMQKHLAAPDRQSFTMLADLNLYGKYLVDAVGRPLLPVEQGFTEDRYEQVIGRAGDLPWAEPPDIVAVDRASTEPVVSFIFLIFKPLQEYSHLIEANPRMNLIYDDGSILLGKPNVYDAPRGSKGERTDAHR